MKTLTFALLSLFSLSVLACPPGEKTLYLLKPGQTLSGIKLNDCDLDEQEIYLALPKKKDKSFSIQVLNNTDNFLISMKDKKGNFKVNMYKKSQSQYGGEISFMDRFNVMGEVNRNQELNHFDVTHFQEFALYKVDFHRVTVEPLVQQSVFFYGSSTTMPQSITDIQPSSLGLNLSGKKAKLGISAGPVMTYVSGGTSNGLDYGGKVNIRFTIPLH